MTKVNWTKSELETARPRPRLNETDADTDELLQELEKLFQAKIQDAEKAKRILYRALIELAECMRKHGIDPNE